MSRTADPHVRKRNEQLVKDYRENRNQSYEDLMGRYHVSKQTVFLILKKAELINRDNKKQRETVETRAARSNLHTQIGVLLERAVNEKILDRTRDVTYSWGDASRDLGLHGAFHLARIFHGHADLTLSEILRIAAFMKMSAGELISKAEETICKNYGKQRVNTGC